MNTFLTLSPNFVVYFEENVIIAETAAIVIVGVFK